MEENNQPEMIDITGIYFLGGRLDTFEPFDEVTKKIENSFEDKWLKFADVWGNTHRFKAKYAIDIFSYKAPKENYSNRK